MSTKIGKDLKSGGFGLDADIHIRYELVGDWIEANYMLKTFPNRVNRGINIALRDFTRRYAKQVKTNIKNQGASLGWEPISSEYRDFKQLYAKGDPDQLLRFFGYLESSIGAFKNGNSWVAGIKTGIYNEEMGMIRDGNTLQVHEYAAVLEYGSIQRNIPARPLWGPSFSQIGGKSVLKATLITSIKAQFPSVKLRMK